MEKEDSDSNKECNVGENTTKSKEKKEVLMVHDVVNIYKTNSRTTSYGTFRAFYSLSSQWRFTPSEQTTKRLALEPKSETRRKLRRRRDGRQCK